MKIKISILVIIFLAVSDSLFGQFAVNITASKLKTCQDTVIIFKALATNGGIPENNATFTWSFGDGTNEISGFMLDSVNHSFSKGGGYMIKVVATDGVSTDYALLKAEIGLKPDFTGTKSDRDAPFCLGQQLFLTGKSSPIIWKYECPDDHTEPFPMLVSDLQIYKSVFDKRIFNKSQVITVGTDIDTVGIKLEHSDLSSVKIELKCPDGNTIILKNYGGPAKYFGEPVDLEGSTEPGIGYEYYWTNSPTFGTMNSSSPAGTSLPAGSYAPEQPFSGLNGCSLNGSWEIIVTDNQAIDNGFVFSTELKLDESLIPAPWEYSNTYSSPLWLGNGVTSTSGTGLATAIPIVHGNHRYTFRVKDSYNCFQDTSFINSVEAVTFSTTPDPPEGVFDLDVEFKSTTSWATTFEWSFGDLGDKGFTSPYTHTYTKDGKFRASLKAGTDDGCSDTTSVLIIVSIPQLIFSEMPGVFSPNGDGENDVYYLRSEALVGIKTLNCWIYSRWGKKVAEWNSVEDAIAGWDGKVKGGNEASPGVYYYYIKVVSFDDEIKEKKGSFHLFR